MVTLVLCWCHCYACFFILILPILLDHWGEILSCSGGGPPCFAQLPLSAHLHPATHGSLRHLPWERAAWHRGDGRNCGAQAAHPAWREGLGEVREGMGEDSRTTPEGCNHHAGPNAILLFYKTEEEMKAVTNKDCELWLYKGGSKLLEIWDSQRSLPLLTFYVCVKTIAVIKIFCKYNGTNLAN